MFDISLTAVITETMQLKDLFRTIGNQEDPSELSKDQLDREIGRSNLSAACKTTASIAAFGVTAAVPHLPTQIATGALTAFFAFKAIGQARTSHRLNCEQTNRNKKDYKFSKRENI